MLTRKLISRVLPFRHSTGFISYNTIMTKTALVVVANGSEEMEVITPIDTLRRAQVEVTVAGLHDKNTVTLSRGVFLVPEKSLEEATASTIYDAIILPGGLGGSELFVQSEALGAVLKKQEKAGSLIAAICAAPNALKKYGICLGRPITSYPTSKEKMSDGNLYQYKEDRVVVADNLITSRGPGTALEWSLAITEYLVGKENTEVVKKAMLVKE